MATLRAASAWGTTVYHQTTTNRPRTPSPTSSLATRTKTRASRIPSRWRWVVGRASACFGSCGGGETSLLNENGEFLAPGGACCAAMDAGPAAGSGRAGAAGGGIVVA
eukprot:scaffold80240_cov28-Tisochrysis_lutea.AAC.5